MILPSLICVWLTVCAVADYRSRQVSNWLTFPAIAGAAVHWARQVSLSSVLLLIFVSGLLYWIWQRGWLGGADCKAALALLLFDPGLLLWANYGVIASYFCWTRVVSKGTTRTMPAFVGFMLGSYCYWIVRMING